MPNKPPLRGAAPALPARCKAAPPCPNPPATAHGPARLAPQPPTLPRCTPANRALLPWHRRHTPHTTPHAEPCRHHTAPTNGTKPPAAGHSERAQRASTPHRAAPITGTTGHRAATGASGASDPIKLINVKCTEKWYTYTCQSSNYHYICHRLNS